MAVLSFSLFSFEPLGLINRVNTVVKTYDMNKDCNKAKRIAKIEKG
jgi:hypothetical protein